MESEPAPRRWGLLQFLLVVPLAGVLIAGVGGAVWMWMPNFRQARTDLVTHDVKRENLLLTIMERGTLESADNRDIFCRVKAGNKGSTVSTTIKWVIDDGSHVKKGQLLIDLDDSGLQEQLKAQRIVLDQARAAWISADENYKIIESQNESDLKTAEVTLELASLDLRKYLEGDYRQTQEDIKGRTYLAQSDLEMWRDRAAWTERMVKKGYLTASQAQSERARQESARIALEKVREERRVLEEYTYVRTKKDWESKIAEAERALERVKKQARAKEVTAEADRQSKLSIFRQEEAKLAEVEEEIRKCTITAPQDGMVVYFIPESSFFGSSSQQSIVAQGEPVREGQRLMRIPDLSRMLVNAKVHEALVSRVKGEEYARTGFTDATRAAMLFDTNALSRLLAINAFAELREQFRDKEQKLVYPGQRALVRVEAYPNKVHRAHVKQVATVASQADRYSSDVKVYQTLVSIDEPVESLKPGMSAEVTIFSDRQMENVLAIPLQAVLATGELGPRRRCYVIDPQTKEPVERDISIGMTNEKMAEVKTGLEEGDVVVMNPKSLPQEKAKGGNSRLTGAVEGLLPGKAPGEGGGSPEGKGAGKRGGGKKGGGGPPPGI